MRACTREPAAPWESWGRSGWEKKQSCFDSEVKTPRKARSHVRTKDVIYSRRRVNHKEKGGVQRAKDYLSLVNLVRQSSIEHLQGWCTMERIECTKKNIMPSRMFWPNKTRPKKMDTFYLSSVSEPVVWLRFSSLSGMISLCSQGNPWRSSRCYLCVG